MKSNGFLKLSRNMLTQPEVADMYAEEGATGLGLYVAINLYLSHCEGGWGVYNGRQLSVIALEGHRHRSDVKRVVEDYGLFVIEGSRFTSIWMQQQYGKVAARLRQGCGTPARTSLLRAEDIEIEIEKEKQKKCVCLDDTHAGFSDSPQPLRAQSEFETVRDGRRYASHGQPLPDDAPPQRHRNWFYSHTKHDWVPAEDFNFLARTTGRKDLAAQK